MSQLLETLCVVGSCPSIFKTSNGNYVIVGKQINQIDLERNVQDKIGPNEAAIEVPAELFKKLPSHI